MNQRDAERALTEIAKLLGMPEAADSYIKHRRAAEHAVQQARELEVQMISSSTHRR